MADDFFKLLGRIEVDQDALKKSLGDSESLVRQWGDRNKRLWNEGLTPSRVAGSTDQRSMQGDKNDVMQVGGLYSRANAPIFSQEGQRGLTAAKLHEGAKRAAEMAEESAKKVEGLGRAFGSAGTTGRAFASVLGLIHPALGQGAMMASRFAPMLLGLGATLGSVAAVGAIAAVAIGVYVKGQLSALNTSIAIGVALKNQDWGSISSGLQKATATVEEYEAVSQRVLGPAGIQRELAEIKKWWFDIWGTAKEAKAQQEAFLASGKTFGNSGIAKRLEADSALALLDVSKKQIELDRFSIASDADRDRLSKLTIENIRAETEEKLKKIEADRADIKNKVDNKKMLVEEGAARNKNLDVQADALRLTMKQALTAEERTLAKVQADAAVLRETYAQKDIQRTQARIVSLAAMAQAIISSEQAIIDLHNERIGFTEKAETLEKRLSVQKTLALAPILTGIKAENEAYESQKRSIQALIEAGGDREKNVADLAELEKSHSATIEEMQRKRITTIAALEEAAAQAREARNQKEIANEEKRLSHSVAMGRTSIQDQINEAQKAITDPRRTLDQQEAAERTAFEKKRSLIENEFALRKSLGEDVAAEELKAQEHLLAQFKAGSDQYYSQVKKISDLLKADMALKDQQQKQYEDSKKPGGKGLVYRDANGNPTMFKPQGFGEGNNPGQVKYNWAIGHDPASSNALKDSIGRAATQGQDEAVRPEKAFASIAEKAGAASQALDELTAAAEGAAGALQGVRGGGDGSNGEAPSRPGRSLPTMRGGESSYTNMPQLDQFFGQNLADAKKRSGDVE